MRAVACILIVSGLCFAQGPQPLSISSKTDVTMTAPPKAKVETVVDDYHGHKISDPYRWLENAGSPDTQKFVAEQNAYTRQLLDAIPGRDKLRAGIQKLANLGAIGTFKPRGNHYFYTRRDGHQNQFVIMAREGLDGKDRTLVDVNTLATDGTVALDWWFPSDDGQLVAYGTSANGSENSTLKIVETATGKLLPEHIERTRANSLAWLPDGSGVYYTRYPRPGDVPAGQEVYHRHVFFHKLGDPANTDGLKDPLIFGEELSPELWPNVQISDDGKWLLIEVSEGWTKSELYLKDLSSSGSKFVRLTSGKTFLYKGEIFDGHLYITTNEEGPRYHVYKAACSHPERSAWKEIIPQSDAVIQEGGAHIVGKKIFVEYIKAGTSAVSIYDLEGKHVADVAMPALGSIVNNYIGGQWNGREAFITFTSYAIPVNVYRIGLDGKISEYMHVPSDIDAKRYEVKQLWFHSKDGTRVPMFVVHKKGLVLNGKNPTMLYGYGGFNVTLSPQFNRNNMLELLERGGVYAEAQLRGGNEFGEEWHRAGMLEKKQNVFDDFIAAAEYLIAQKYTDKDHLAIMGGSNGGLLMGAVLTQRPDLFRAVICTVPLLDMLRYQNFQIAKLWIPEYGSAEDPQQFDFIYAYSPYHHVKQGATYPAILFMTADSDTRVDPMHAKKMTALLQAEAGNGPDRPILLRVDTKAGHGAGKPIAKLVDDAVDGLSFVFWQLGISK